MSTKKPLRNPGIRHSKLLFNTDTLHSNFYYFPIFHYLKLKPAKLNDLKKELKKSMFLKFVPFQLLNNKEK